MKIFRIHIRGWTSSFRYPTFISGFQPTLVVPPLSTIYGLLSAAAGRTVTPADTDVGYVFVYESKAVDMEAIYELTGKLSAKTNIVNREILYQPELFLYIANPDIAENFSKPHYPLVFGRSTELVTISEIKETELVSRTNVRLGCTLLPFPTKGVHGPIQALPHHVTNEIPRKAVGTKPYYTLDFCVEYNENEILYDQEKNWGVWMHHAE